MSLGDGVGGGTLSGSTTWPYVGTTAPTTNQGPVLVGATREMAVLLEWDETLGAYARKLRVLSGSRLPIGLQTPIRCVGWGDSLTAGSGGYFGSYYEEVIRQSKGRFVSLGNLGVGGETAQQVFARRESVYALNPDAVFICVGQNNIALGTLLTPGGTLSDIETEVDALLARGIIPILVPLAPDNAPASVALKGVFNSVLAYIANKHGCPIYYDLWDAIRDTSTGAFLPDMYYSPSPVHVSYAGCVAAVSASLPAFLAGTGTQAGLNTNPLTTGQLVNNPYFTTDTNADGLAESWTVAGTGATATLEEEADVVQGRWQKLTKTSATGGANVATTIATTNFEVGDKLLVCARMKTANLVGRYVVLYCNFAGTGVYAGNTPSNPIVWAPNQSAFDVMDVITVPVKNLLSVTPTIAGGTGSGSGELWINRPQVVNLATLGID